MYQADNFKIIAFKKPINIEYLYAELTVKYQTAVLALH